MKHVDATARACEARGSTGKGCAHPCAKHPQRSAASEAASTSKAPTTQASAHRLQDAAKQGDKPAQGQSLVQAMSLRRLKQARAEIFDHYEGPTTGGWRRKMSRLLLTELVKKWTPTDLS